MSADTTQHESKKGDKAEAKKAAAKGSKKARVGAEAAPRFPLIPGLMESEKRTVSLSGESKVAMAKFLKGAGTGVTESDVLVAATMKAMTGGAPKLPPKLPGVELEVTQPKPMWTYQEELAKSSGYTLAEVQEALLKAYLDR
jgi:hypothetical protein